MNDWVLRMEEILTRDIRTINPYTCKLCGTNNAEINSWCKGCKEDKENCVDDSRVRMKNKLTSKW